MNISVLLSVSPIYAAVLGLIFVVVTVRVGLYRVNNEISLGDGGDAELLKRIRGQGNFVETVPLLLIMLVLMELVGASSAWLHVVGGGLVAARILHYIGLTGIGPNICRTVGMLATIVAYFSASGWLFYHFV